MAACDLAQYLREILFSGFLSANLGLKASKNKRRQRVEYSGLTQLPKVTLH